jgi:hypothetical protein
MSVIVSVSIEVRHRERCGERRRMMMSVAVVAVLDVSRVPRYSESGMPAVILHGARAALREEDVTARPYMESPGLGMR